ncbi:hypothetical protein GCM10022254_72520 [Actinomadura meridiana]|uniref:ACT domain-containing protein n=1 Tax=Actinomadura meridiana TaxID=559626 RepID=A0ABP8CQ19_9ACTN
MMLRIRIRLPDRPGSLGRVARTRGAEILADAVPAILSADWAGLAEQTADGDAVLVHASAGAAPGAGLPDLAPLRPRAFTAPDGTRFAVCPLSGGALALVVARTGAPPFHRTEVCRLEQLAGAADAVLARRLGPAGERLSPAGEAPSPGR